MSEPMTTQDLIDHWRAQRHLERERRRRLRLILRADKQRRDPLAALKTQCAINESLLREAQYLQGIERLRKDGGR